jgi:hypothetical protein
MQGTYQREKTRLSQQTEERAVQLLPDRFQRRAKFAHVNPIGEKDGGRLVVWWQTASTIFA